MHRKEAKTRSNRNLLRLKKERNPSEKKIIWWRTAPVGWSEKNLLPPDGRGANSRLAVAGGEFSSREILRPSPAARSPDSPSPAVKSPADWRRRWWRFIYVAVGEPFSGLVERVRLGQKPDFSRPIRPNKYPLKAQNGIYHAPFCHLGAPHPSLAVRHFQSRIPHFFKK